MGNGRKRPNNERPFLSIARQAYPLSRGYIARQSSHSTGLSVDLAIDGLDFGTPFDFFDPRSSTRSQLVTAEATTNRKKLLELMLHRGFSNYQREWWHFTYTEARDSKPWDMEVK
jgi:zinc D-Ala-D-Ala dipeptidase